MPRNNHQRPRSNNIFGYTEGADWKYNEKTQKIVKRLKAEYQQQLKDEEHRIASTKGIGFDTSKEPPEKPLIFHYTPEEWEEKQEKKKQRDEFKNWKNKQYHSFKYRAKKYNVIKEFKRKINELAEELKVEGIEVRCKVNLLRVNEFIYEKGIFTRDTDIIESKSDKYEKNIRERLEKLQKKLGTTEQKQSLINEYNTILGDVRKFFKQNHTGGENGQDKCN